MSELFDALLAVHTKVQIVGVQQHGSQHEDGVTAVNSCDVEVVVEAGPVPVLGASYVLVPVPESDEVER